MAKKLVMYYGTECVHCHEMFPMIEKVEKELKVKIVKKEVWHNEKNLGEMKRCDKGVCTAVPYFYNESSGKSICGSCDYEALKKWASGK